MSNDRPGIAIVLAVVVLIMALLSGCGGGSAPSVWKEETPFDAAVEGEGEPLYVPRHPESAQNPAFSPDGSMILFTIFHGGYNEGPAGLYLLEVENGFISPLLDEPDQDSVNLPGSCWNGATGRIAFSSDREDGGEIWTVDEQGESLYRVTRHDPSDSFLEPSFSPDGQWIVFECESREGEGPLRGSIWKVRSDGTDLTRLSGGSGSFTDDRQPNWSWSGDRILFQRRDLDGEDWDISPWRRMGATSTM